MSVLTESLEKLLCDFLSLNENDWVLWTAQPNDWNDDCDKFNGCFFVVKNMPRYPQHANCKDKICVNHNKINKNNESIICLPNKVIVTVVSDKGGDVDEVAR